MDIECDIPPVHSPVQTPPSPVGTPASLEWSSKPILGLPVIPSPIASPVPAAALDKDALLKIGAQLELHGKAVSDEIYSHRFRLRILERVQEEYEITMGTLWRPILEIYDLRRHHVADQRKVQELRERIAALERRMDHREE
ncbi:hypothetical protein Tco_0824386 [Tanacetum coccineum]|uniref:Uncharacterized protein n=1 Tax=Tanacetum coccineum TaxID=301880 RepID=A0ABQ5ANM2_9ASTR